MSDRHGVADGAADARLRRGWAALAAVPDPEVPAVSVCELGIVRDLRRAGAGLDVVLTPTYSGCPATEAIADAVVAALEAEGLGPVRVVLQRAPAWTSDWISAEGRRKLLDYGIVPPAPADAAGRDDDVGRPLGATARPVVLPLACPRCASRRTERLSAFGSTACKSLHRCLACREPFEYFKPI